MARVVTADGRLVWLEAIGGGLSAVVIVVQAWVIIALWKRVNELSDKLLNTTLEMGKENRDLLVVTNTTISTATGTIAAAIKRLDGVRK